MNGEIKALGRVYSKASGGGSRDMSDTLDDPDTYAYEAHKHACQVDMVVEDLMLMSCSDQSDLVAVPHKMNYSYAMRFTRNILWYRGVTFPVTNFKDAVFDLYQKILEKDEHFPKRMGLSEFSDCAQACLVKSLQVTKAGTGRYFLGNDPPACFQEKGCRDFGFVVA